MYNDQGEVVNVSGVRIDKWQLEMWMNSWITCGLKMHIKLARLIDLQLSSIEKVGYYRPVVMF